MAGATGLDYNAVKLIADTSDADFGEVFPLFQMLEAEQLTLWADERDAEDAKSKNKKGA